MFVDKWNTSRYMELTIRMVLLCMEAIIKSTIIIRYHIVNINAGKVQILHNKIIA